MAYIHLNRHPKASSMSTKNSTEIKYNCLDQAKEIIEGKRSLHGTPENSFKAIGGLWSEYLERTITPHDVAIMMVLFKIGRIKSGHLKCNSDNYVDICGYAALADELRLQEVEDHYAPY